MFKKAITPATGFQTGAIRLHFAFAPCNPISGTSHIQGKQGVTGERAARVPRGGWEAYTAVRGRWVEPDPLQAYLEATLSANERRFDMAAFCALPRHSAEPPGAREVQTALETALTPADVYRVVWKAPPSETDAGSRKPADNRSSRAAMEPHGQSPWYLRHAQ